jgi:hypothetical protein
LREILVNTVGQAYRAAILTLLAIAIITIIDPQVSANTAGQAVVGPSRVFSD